MLLLAKKDSVVLFFAIGVFYIYGETSLTDNSPYTHFCYEAAIKSELFETFRRAPVYMAIVETLGRDQGEAFAQELKKSYPQFLMLINRFQTSEQIGKPHIYSYEGIGFIAPTTLRYIKVAYDLQRLFGSLAGLSIVEIGGGYGGQCKIIADMFLFKAYTIIDLPGPLAIAKKFLHEHGVQNVTFLTPAEIAGEDIFDLVISNYAFSECTLKMQQFYVDKVFKQSRHGYCICNRVAHQNADYATKKQLLSLLTGSTIQWQESPEVPCTDPYNYVLTWNETQ